MYVRINKAHAVVSCPLRSLCVWGVQQWTQRWQVDVDRWGLAFPCFRTGHCGVRMVRVTLQTITIHRIIAQIY